MYLLLKDYYKYYRILLINKNKRNIKYYWPTKRDVRPLYIYNSRLMSHRNMKYFHDNRLIYRRDPISDVPYSQHYWGDYYKDGTYQCYTLFNSKAKINSFKSLKWHLLVLWHINNNMSLKDFKTLTRHIVKVENGFITFTLSEKLINVVINDVYQSDLDRPPKNRIRKIIFKDGLNITVSEKLSIVGSVIGRTKQADSSDIYETMLLINENKKKITISKLAKLLNVSTRTIFRNMNEALNAEKKILNEKL